MNRRIVGIALAVILGLGGTFALVKYVQSARDDAAEPEPTTTVVIVTKALPQGASFSQIESNTESAEIPERLVAPDALEDLDQLSEELVASVELRPGEQLLRSRLVQPRTLVSVAIPDGLQELTIAFDPERALGGQVEPGDSVGVLLSFEPFEVTASTQEAPVDGTEPAGAETVTTTRTPKTTHLTLDQILVTGVQYSQIDAERSTETRDDTDGDGGNDDVAVAADINEAPRDQLLVTVAVTASEAEQIVFTAEFGRIWLTGQTPDTDEDGTRILTLEQVYVAVPR